jgi:hypothetical protein
MPGKRPLETVERPDPGLKIKCLSKDSHPGLHRFASSEARARLKNADPQQNRKECGEAVTGIAGAVTDAHGKVRERDRRNGRRRSTCMAANEARRFTPVDFFHDPAHFRCPSIRETSSEVGDRFCTRRAGLFVVELIMGCVLFIGMLRRTRLPFPSRVFAIVVCAMAAALKQNNKPNVRTALVIALMPICSPGRCGSGTAKKLAR